MSLSFFIRKVRGKSILFFKLKVSEQWHNIRLQLVFTAKARRKTFRTELQSARKASSKEIKSGAYKIPP